MDMAMDTTKTPTTKENLLMNNPPRRLVVIVQYQSKHLFHSVTLLIIMISN